MQTHQATRQFLAFLHDNPSIRGRIRARPNRTLLYAGSGLKPMWKEIADLKRAHPELAGEETLPEVLATLPVPGTGGSTLLAYAKDVEGQVPSRPDGFVMWRALSGIFASNAVGSVSFQIGAGVAREHKVFAATEIWVLLRNPNVDARTRDLLQYYERCIRSGVADLNVSVMFK